MSYGIMHYAATMTRIPLSDQELLKRAQSKIDKARAALERSRDRIARTEARLVELNRSMRGDQDG
ncbi:hypothetical protein [Sphingomonas sp. BAUL-RG-20F-R05-02]|uniref:hypothetical protein n=1 Tax=Sphingomonas sp. BAUL-RG-20F-R05-02 TaxID=2914830 RepID=UPI001F56F32B|nr:hypothetical protein [Sphingomonas sp. BAUL-RG-20F-R05-02]